MGYLVGQGFGEKIEILFVEKVRVSGNRIGEQGQDAPDVVLQVLPNMQTDFPELEEGVSGEDDEQTEALIDHPVSDEGTVQYFHGSSPF
ncbi:MAG: hypothetical protein WC560_06010 [Syntrophales bacterium]